MSNRKHMTAREINTLLRMCGEGKSSKEIAVKLNRSHNSIMTTIWRYRKMLSVEVGKSPETNTPSKPKPKPVSWWSKLFGVSPRN